MIQSVRGQALPVAPAALPALLMRIAVVLFAMLVALVAHADEAAKLDIEQARRMATKGDANFQAGLGAALLFGKGVTKNEAEGVSWLRKSADQGNATGQALLGQAYLQGLGVAKDEAAGFAWTKKAAEGGMADAQTALAGLYFRGRGVDKDAKEGVRWMQKAADNGSKEAQAALKLIMQAIAAEAMKAKPPAAATPKP